MIRLKLVSMNLAGRIPSAEAPPTWNQSHVAQAIAKEILAQNPDIIALQECPEDDDEEGEAWVEEYFPGYTLMGVRWAHAGSVMLLVRQALPMIAESISLPPGIPAVMAQLQPMGTTAAASTTPVPTVLIASCHLAPFREGARQRSYQIKTLLEMLQITDNSKESMHGLIIAGDTNMRPSEDNTMEGTYGMMDAWKATGSNPSTQYTWDTRNHLQNEENNDGGYFNRYYGANTREYAARYDRIYIATPKNNNNAAVTKATTSSSGGQGDSKEQLSVESFALIANKPVTLSSRTHFLSDHFGIVSEIQFQH